MKKIIGIDYGRARIGLASATEGIMISSPTGTIKGGKTPEESATLLAAHLNLPEIARLVIGLPLHMDGKESPMSAEVRKFATKLEELTQLPVVLWDERMSSLSATRMLKEADLSRKQRTGKTDPVAASIILQSYLESQLI